MDSCPIQTSASPFDRYTPRGPVAAVQCHVSFIYVWSLYVCQQFEVEGTTVRAVGDSRRPTGGGSGVVAGTGTGSVNGQFLPSEVQNRVQLEQLTWLAKLQVREHCRALSVIGSSWRFLSLPLGCLHRLVGLRSSKQEIIAERSSFSVAVGGSSVCRSDAFSAS